MTAPRPSALDGPSRWQLDPTLTFLNHGSFGSLPHAVALRQQEWRSFIEASPIERLGRRCTELLAEARGALARFVGAEADDLGFVTNATEGINAVLRSVRLEPGDELLTTDHVYNAVRQTMRHVARAAGATYHEIPIDVPLLDAAAVIERIGERLSARTRLLVIDHVTSPTAVVLPVEGVIQLCAERGVDVLVDGAHAPGMLPLALDELGAAYYAANLHKWVCAPKGAAFLHVRRDRQRGVHPATISHFLDEGFRREFDWQGTRDITPWLTLPAALEFMDDQGGGLGWRRVLRHNHAMATWAHRMLIERLATEPISPLDGRFLGSMATVPLPAALQPGDAPQDSFEALQRELHDRFRIEVPIMSWRGRWHVRISCQVYNAPEQYERLAEAIDVLARERGRWGSGA